MPPEQHVECKYGDAIPRLIERLDIFMKVMKEDIDQGRETDLRQFEMIGEQGERIAKVETCVEDIREKITNGGIKATAIVQPDKSLDFWPTIAAIKKKYLLLIFFGGSGGILFLLDVAEKIIHALQTSLQAM